MPETTKAPRQRGLMELTANDNSCLNLTTSPNDFQEKMQQAMEADGIFPAEQIIPDGVFRRIDDANGKPKNQYIFAVCFGHSGFYGHWITLRDGKNWSSKREVEFTPEERQEYAIQMQKARKDRAKAEEQRHCECRERSLEIWNQSPLADADHPYLIKKGIQAHGIKCHQGRLVIPVYSIDRTLHGLQYIDENGGKKFEPGTAVKGNFWRIPGDTSKPIYIAEGFSTAAAIHELTGATVIIAFSCGNLMAVTEVIRARIGGAK